MAQPTDSWTRKRHKQEPSRHRQRRTQAVQGTDRQTGVDSTYREESLNDGPADRLVDARDTNTNTATHRERARESEIETETETETEPEPERHSVPSCRRELGQRPSRQTRGSASQ
jgi:hypothetical protein